MIIQLVYWLGAFDPKTWKAENSIYYESEQRSMPVETWNHQIFPEKIILWSLM